MLKKNIEKDKFFELMAPVTLNTVCFRFNPNNAVKSQLLNNLNEKLLNILNKSGKLYLTHTKIKGDFVIRMVVSQTYVTAKHVENAWERIKKTAQDLNKMEG
ncbi:hypothetical protein ES708_32982 [subsurface metagenome]